MAMETIRGSMVRVYCSEADSWQGQRLYEVIVTKAREAELMRATVYRGVEGFGESAEIHKPRFWPFGDKDAPIMITLIDQEEKMSRFLLQLDELLSEGLIASSSVSLVRFKRDEALNTTPNAA